MNRNSSMTGLASLVQSRGRGDDSVLVHMTPGEVKGLQALALAHGGQLTINPETGLYEANFLKKLLPTIIGAVLTPLTGGLINPFTAGLLVGGVETIRTGDLGRGLMAGLGAYGGAGLSTALAGTGAAAAQAGAGEAIKAAGADAATKAATEAGKTATEELIKRKTQEEAAKRIAEQTATNGLFGRLPENVASFSNIGKGFGEIVGGGANLGGIGSLSTAGSALGAAFPSQIGKGAAIMGASNALTPEMEMPEGGAYNIDDSYYESYGYDPAQGRFLGGQWRKGYPGFPGYADGGAVIPRPNYNYPLSKVSQAGGGYQVDVDPYTGEERFADGGAVDQDRIPTQVTPDNDLIMSTMPVREAPQQSLQQYYQSLLTPPQQQAYDPSFFNYMQSLNKFVTSPVAPPPPPPKTGYVPPPPGTVANQPNNIDYNAIRAALGGKFGQFGNMIDFSSLQNRGGDDRLVWDSAQGRFVNPAPVAAPSPYQSNPRFDIGPVDPADFAPPTEEDIAASQKYLSMFDVSGNPPVGASQFAEPSYNQPFQYDFSGLGQMGDMGGYNTQFQGFQALPTDFGSTYQPPAMDMSTFNAAAYTPPQVDFGNMYGLSSLSPMPSYQSTPMTTSTDTGVSNVSTAPQFGFGNSDVLYGQSNFGQGGEQNIFGFASGGAIEKAAAGKLVTGDGDGMSDDIRANINGNQEARLADGEFVIPADVVSHIGNGSTDAGADRLYSMMDRIRKARTGRTRQAPEIDADKYLPA